MEASIGFLKGMKQDLDNKLLDGNSYYEAINKQVVLDDLSATGAISDEPGNKLVTGSLGLTAQDTMIKTVSVRDWVISFIKNTSFEGNRIIKYKITSAGAIANLSTVYTTYTGSTSLGQWFGDNIDCVVRYRDENLCKLYWTDGINQLRHINIFADNSSLDISLLDISPSANIYEPTVLNVVNGGRLNIGKYQYAYQYFNKNGAETVYSQLSKPVDITRGSLTQFSEFAGGDPEDVSNKSVILQVANIDTKFEYVRILSVYYKDPFTAPEIRIINEVEINGESSVTLKDAGGTFLDIITPEELNFAGSKTIIPTTLTNKDNHLIAGNVKEEYFDIDEETGSYWDARAFRYEYASTNSRIDAASGDIGDSIIVANDFSNVPETFDCIQDKANQQSIFNHKKYATVLGGTGKNIAYEFVTKDVVIDTDLSQPTINNSSNSTIWNSGDNASLMRNEIYRFGIVFLKDGKYSFVKWIADILTPDWDIKEGIYKPFITETVGGITSLKARVLGIKFIVSNVPTGYSWQIVRVPRNFEDKTVLTQAAIGTIKYKNIEAGGYDANHKYYRDAQNDKLYSYFNAPDINESLVYLNSTDINYNSSRIDHINGDALNLLDIYKTTASVTDALIDVSELPLPKNFVFTSISKFTGFLSGVKLVNSLDVPVSPVTTKSRTIPLHTSIKVGPLEAAYIPNDSSIPNFINKVSSFDDLPYAIGNTSLIASLSAPMEEEGGSVPNGLTTHGYIGVCNYERNSDGIYGGNSYVNKLASLYVKVSDITSGSGTVDTYNGDTYLQLFEYLDFSFDQQKHHTVPAISTTIIVPLECSINLNHVHGYLRSRDFTARQLFILQETNDIGKRLFPTGDATSGITTETGIIYYNFYDDIYKYNPVFSRELQARTFFSKPLNFEKIEHYDTRVVNSEMTSTSIVDNWTKFLYSSYQDLDPEHGKLNKLYVFNNKLYGFQDSAVAVIGFNDRELVQSDSATTLTLGTGDKLTYHQYLTTYSGCMHLNSLIDTGRALYYFDLINKSFYRITDSIEDISNTKGLSRLFKNRNYTSITDVLTGYDAINSRVFLTIQASTPTTISFNERLDAFESLHTYYPKIYLNHLGKLYTTILRDLYIHGEGEILRFYGAAPQSNTESSFTFIINDKPTKKTFTNLEFDTNILNYITNAYAEPSTPAIPVISIETSNSYQSVTKASTALILKRRFRTWRYIIPKDNFKGRFVDYFLKTTIKNRITHSATANNNTTVISGVKVYYLIPMI